MTRVSTTAADKIQFICIAPFYNKIVSRCFTESATQSQNPHVSKVTRKNSLLTGRHLEQQKVCVNVKFRKIKPPKEGKLIINHFNVTEPSKFSPWTLVVLVLVLLLSNLPKCVSSNQLPSKPSVTATF